MASPPLDRRVALFIGLLSAALLLVEISLTRIFSAVLYYHFAFMAISLALFGLAAGGLVVHLTQRRPAHTQSAIARLALVFAATNLGGFLYYVEARVPFADCTAAAFAPLLAMFLAAALPYVAVGAALALAFDRYATQAGQLYAWNLVGSALGCLLVVPLLDAVGAVQLVFMVTAAIGALCLLGLASRAWRLAAVVVAATALLLMLAQARSPWLSAGSIKAQGIATELERAERGDPTGPFELAFSGWNSYSKVALYKQRAASPGITWGTTPADRLPPVEQMILLIDNLAATPVTRFTGDVEALAHLQLDVTAAPYLLAQQPTALVIGAGGGRDVLTALAFGARRVVAVEINPLVVEPLAGDFASFTGGIYDDHPQVEVVIDEGRSFVRRDPRQYDVIQIAMIDTWAATASGAFALTENTLYTVEAIRDYLTRLTDTGVLSISRFISDPPQQGLRLLALYKAAAGELGLEPFEQHLLVVAANPTVTCILRKTPFTDQEVRRFDSAAAARGFAVLHAPGLAVPHSPVGEVYHRLITSKDVDAFAQDYMFDVSPSRDDRPFFFNMARFKDAFATPAYAAGQEFNQAAVTALMTLLAVVTALAGVFLLAPALLLRRRRTRRTPDAPFQAVPMAAWLLYFGTLGVGFMFFEIPLIQKLVLLLGHPVHATSVVLFALLLSSGIGSWLSARISLARWRRHLVASAIILIGVTWWIAWGLDLRLAAWAALPLVVRISIAVATIAPAGLILGTLFPLGMRAADGQGRVAFLWGWNGATSVLGSVLAVIVAMQWGFRATFVAAAAIYLVGLLAFAAVVTLVLRAAAAHQR